ncbi:acyl-CoA dehydrogenase family protein [Alcaligenes sp. SDU_A2]|uniref:acyl-CoA dehydrogenase family protein n=1 Tax=Alcaligenes sp. SDU_A2 TaxID=3136634 RepID=UPI00311F6390
MNLDRERRSQVPDLVDDDLLLDDPVLLDWLQRSLLTGEQHGLEGYGRTLGSAQWRAQAALANAQPPSCRLWSAQGERIDQLEFHPAWHALMALGMERGLHVWPQTGSAGLHLARAVGFYMHGQIEAGTLCPMTMTRAAAPLLQGDDFGQWRNRLARCEYDAASVPVSSKRSVVVGMGMTEMQGGSDLRGCTTQAQPEAAAFRVFGHKWFFSVPQADAHLVLARDQEQLSCFLVPRLLASGERNGVRIRRLKDKLGNRSNASAEVEFDGAVGWRVGQPGRGIAMLAGMAARTRVDCVLGSAALMRQALVQSLHYCRHRRAFGKVLIDQPLMQAVLLDMALESEAAAHLGFFLVQLQGRDDASAQGVLRVLAPVAKFWVCRRAVALCAEAMETWGGNGYIEDGPMPRLLREAPVNSIWEGSGNVMCLDAQRALAQAQVHAALQDDLSRRCAGDTRLEAAARALMGVSELAGGRAWAQSLALLYQACLMRELAPAGLADLFIDDRLSGGPRAVFGLEGVSAARDYLLRSWPRLQA